MAQPLFKAKVGQYELASWENKVNINGTEVPKLGFTLTKSYKVKEEWKNQVVNVSSITELRQLPQILTYLALKGEKMIEEFEKLNSKPQTPTPEAKPVQPTQQI